MAGNDERERVARHHHATSRGFARPRAARARRTSPSGVRSDLAQGLEDAAVRLVDAVQSIIDLEILALAVDELGHLGGDRVALAVHLRPVRVGHRRLPPGSGPAEALRRSPPPRDPKLVSTARAASASPCGSGYSGHRRAALPPRRALRTWRARPRPPVPARSERPSKRHAGESRQDGCTRGDDRADTGGHLNRP